MDLTYFANEIKRSVSMPELLAAYGFETDRKGFTCCPFHHEKTASFKAYPGDRGYHCFGCGESGDVITFVKRYFNLNFIDTLKKINEDFRLGLPIGEKLTKTKREQIDAEIFRRRKAQEAKKKERQSLQDDYYKLLDEYVRLEKQRKEHAPKAISEVLHPDFVEAIMDLDRVSFLLDCAEMELIEYDNRNAS